MRLASRKLLKTYIRSSALLGVRLLRLLEWMKLKHDSAMITLSWHQAAAEAVYNITRPPCTCVEAWLAEAIASHASLIVYARMLVVAKLCLSPLHENWAIARFLSYDVNCCEFYCVGTFLKFVPTRHTTHNKSHDSGSTVQARWRKA